MDEFQSLLYVDVAGGGELHGCSPESVLDCGRGVGVGVDSVDCLVALKPCSGSDGLSECTAHSAGNTVRSCAGCELVLPENDVGVCPDLEVVALEGELGKYPVGGDTSCLDGSVPDLNAVLYFEGENDGELCFLPFQ